MIDERMVQDKCKQQPPRTISSYNVILYTGKSSLSCTLIFIGGVVSCI